MVKQDYTPQDLKKITLLAALLFDKGEIEIILKDDSEVTTFDEAFQKGQLNEKYEIRKSIFNEAKNGSTAAQKQWVEMSRMVDIERKKKK